MNIDIGIYPVFNDEWTLGKSGLKSLQFMALGIPTIATNIGNIKNIIKNNYNGYLVNDHKEWEIALLNLIDDSNKRKLFGNRSREIIYKYYSNDVISKKYLEVFNKVYVD